jgi:hypothetical protein
MARGGWAESRGREQRAEAEKEKREREHSKPHAYFGRKMVYGNFFRKPFS